MKSNYVIIVRDIAKDFEKVCELSKNSPYIEWHDGFASVIGCFDEDKIEEYEHYDLSVQTDWKTEVSVNDKPLGV